MQCIGLVGGSSGDSLTDQLHDLGYSVASVNGSPGEPGVIQADYSLIIDLDKHEEILSFFEANAVKCVIIGTGHIKAIRLAVFLESKGLITSLDISNAELAKDKVLFKLKLEEMNFLTPRFVSFRTAYSLSEIIEKVGLPCVVKSAIDFIQPQKVKTELELQTAIEEVQATGTEVLIEEFISGNDCTVAVVSDGKETKGLGVLYYSKAKEYGLKGFEGAYTAKLDGEKELELNRLSERLTTNLGFEGLIRVDYVVSEQTNQPYILEVNSVIVTGYNGSAYPFFRKQGIDIAHEMVVNALKMFRNRDER